MMRPALTEPSQRAGLGTSITREVGLHLKPVYFAVSFLWRPYSNQPRQRKSITGDSGSSPQASFFYTFFSMKIPQWWTKPWQSPAREQAPLQQWDSTPSQLSFCFLLKPWAWEVWGYLWAASTKRDTSNDNRVWQESDISQTQLRFYECSNCMVRCVERTLGLFWQKRQLTAFHHYHLHQIYDNKKRSCFKFCFTKALQTRVSLYNIMTCVVYRAYKCTKKVVRLANYTIEDTEKKGTKNNG